MKILWLHSHFLYSLGATKYIFEVCKFLKKKYNLDVIAEDSSEYWKERFNSEGMKLTNTINFSSNRPVYWLLFPFIVLEQILKVKKMAANYDLVITSIFPMNFISIFSGKPTIFLCFEPFSYFYNKDLINKLAIPKRIFTNILSFVYSPLDRLGTLKSGQLITLNKDRAVLIGKTYGREVDGISGMAVDGRYFKPISDRKFSEKYKGKKIILHSTDFTVPKGTDFLIKSLPLIINNIPNVKLLIMSTVQDNNEKKKLTDLIEKTKVKEYVEFLGFVDEKLLPGYYSLADVTAFVADPGNTVSKASLIILESLACETPVISSVSQLAGMENNKTGYVVDPGNSTDLSDKICSILTDSHLQESMGEYGRKLVLKDYGWKNVADVFERQIKLIQ